MRLPRISKKFTGILAAIFVLAWRAAGRLQRTSGEPVLRADALAIQCTLAQFAFFLFYRVALLETLSFQIVFSALLGYLAWMQRAHRLSVAASSA